jgi:hypothetical protein
MKICSVGAELFRADGRTDRHGKTHSRFSQFYELACKERINTVGILVRDIGQYSDLYKVHNVQ